MVDPAADLRPDHWQLVTLVVIGVYILLIMFVWNLPGVKSVLYPFKVLTVAFHEVRNRARGCCRAPTLRNLLTKSVTMRSWTDGLLYAVHSQRPTCRRGGGVATALACCWFVLECGAL